MPEPDRQIEIRYGLNAEVLKFSAINVNPFQQPMNYARIRRPATRCFDTTNISTAMSFLSSTIRFCGASALKRWLGLRQGNSAGPALERIVITTDNITFDADIIQTLQCLTKTKPGRQTLIIAVEDIPGNQNKIHLFGNRLFNNRVKSTKCLNYKRLLFFLLANHRKSANLYVSNRGIAQFG